MGGWHRLAGAVAASLTALLPAQAAPLKPGYIDSAPVLDAAIKAIGTDKIRCLTVSGMHFPTTWHSHQSYDDNYNTQTISSGHHAFGRTLATVKANDCTDAIAVPAGLPAPADITKIETTQLASEVYLIGGTTHNSVAIGFDRYVAVVEAPLSEERSLAVIEEVAWLFPDKPIRYLINPHQHFDHIGGLRTYAHIGATVITHARNYEFYNRDMLNYTPPMMKPDLVSIMPPTELTEGYTDELVRQNYALTNGRTTFINYVQPLEEAEGMLMIMLPQEKIVIEVDLVNGHPDLPGSETDGAKTLLRMVTGLGYTVERVVPIHGQPFAWTDFLASIQVDRKIPERLGIDSPIASIAADPKGRIILDTHIPV